jgi:hypothetical protein
MLHYQVVGLSANVYHIWFGEHLEYITRCTIHQLIEVIENNDETNELCYRQDAIRKNR